MGVALSFVVFLSFLIVMATIPITKRGAELLKAELHRLKTVERPSVIAAISEARAQGDLSENFEYKEAKRAKNRNDSRIRYLEAMIKTARIICGETADDTVGLYDKICVYLPEDGELEFYQIVTTVRCDPTEGRVSKDSPFGRAVFGRRAGERVTVVADGGCRYEVEIRSVEKARDDGSAPLMSY